MATDDLCTFQDLVDEDSRVKDYADDEVKAMIEKKITKLSMEIKMPPRAADISPNNVIVNMCCVYGVLAWMEDQKLLEISKDVKSWSEGDTSATYTDSTRPDAHLSNSEKYLKYLSMITPGNDNLECGSKLLM